MFELPDPLLTPVYHLEATLGEPLNLGGVGASQRRIVPLTAGTFTGPEISGKLVPGASADWQTILPDGTALGDVRYTLQTDSGDLLYVQARGVRHGSPRSLRGWRAVRRSTPASTRSGPRRRSRRPRRFWTG